MRVGISASFLSLLERDKREPTVRVLRDIGNALGVPPGVLVAAALRSDEPTTSAEGARIEAAIEHLVRAAHHYVLSARLNQATETASRKTTTPAALRDFQTPRADSNSDDDC